MKLTCLSQWFPPEKAAIGHVMLEVAKGLVQQSHEVTVITGYPNHPEGQVFGGYRKRLLLYEELDSVQMWRVWLATSSKRAESNRMLMFIKE